MFPLFTNSVDPMFKVRSVELGQAYIEEIMGKKFDEGNQDGSGPRCNEEVYVGGEGKICTPPNGLGSESGETRATYDDVDDYDGMDSNTTGGPQTAAGTLREGFTNYRAQITVFYDDDYNGTADPSTTYSAKLIQVTVTDPRGDKHQFASYRGNF